MNMMHIDTNKAVNQLVKSGLKKETAEIFVEIIESSHKSNLDNLATKPDISDVRKDVANTELKLELKIADVKSELMKEIGIVREGVFEAKLQAAKLHSELREDIKDLKSSLKLVYVLGGVISTGVFTLLSAIAVKIFLG
jgi:type II secretory pathway component PulK